MGADDASVDPSAASTVAWSDSPTATWAASVPIFSSASCGFAATSAVWMTYTSVIPAGVAVSTRSMSGSTSS